MFFHQLWAAKAAKRVGANIIVGAIITSIIGALCVGAAGAVLGWIVDIRSTPASLDDGYMALGLVIGLSMGAWSGILGAIFGGVAALTARPGTLFAPLSVMKRVALGQVLGTLGVLSFYLVFALAVAQLNTQTFIGTVEDNLALALFGVPALMNCGAIMGALWKSAGAPTALAVN